MSSRRRREPAPDPRRVSHAASSRSSIPTPPTPGSREHPSLTSHPSRPSRSADGAYLAASLSTHVVKVYQRGSDGSLGALAELTGHGAPVTDVSFPLPHEPWGALTSSDDGTTRYWDVRAPPQSRETSRYVAHFAKSHATATLGGGNDHLVAAGADAQIVFWDRRAATGLEVFEESHSEDVTRIRFQPSRRNRLFTASVDGLVCAFDCGGNPADINDEDGLLTVMHTGAAVVEIGFCGRGGDSRDDDALWLLTGNEDAWFFDVGGDENTLGDQLAYVPDTRGKATAAAAAAGVAAGGLSESVDYLVRCFSAPGGGPLVAAGTQTGTLGVFPVVMDGSCGPGVGALGAPLAVLDGGHRDIVRAFEPGSTPVTGAEDSRVCAWGDADAAASVASSGSSGGGKAGRHEDGGRRHSPY